MSMPDYSIGDAKGPGILYVNSKIKDASLSAAAFTSWYEDEHIRDIFATSPQGIFSAFRYYSTAPAAVDRPYLALYPLRDVAFLTSDAFRSIPVHSDQLPGNGPIFNLADFDTRYYVLVNRQQRAADAGTCPPACGPASPSLTSQNRRGGS